MNTSQSIDKKTLCAIGMIFFMQGLIFSCISSRVPSFKSLLQINDAELGMLLLALPLGQVCTMALSGYLVSKYTSKIVLQHTIIMYPILLLAALLTTNYYIVCTTFFFLGVCGNMVNISMNTQANKAETVYKKTLTPRFHGLWSLANAIGAMIGMFFIYFKLALAWHYALASTIFWILGFYAKPRLLDTDIENDSQKDTEQEAFRINFFLIFCGIVGFLVAICEGLILNWTSLYFKDVVKVSDSLMGVGYLTCMSALVLGRFTIGYFIDLFGRSKVMFFSGLSISFGLGLAIISPYFLSSVIGMIFLGFGTASVIPMVYSYAGHANPQNPGKAMTVVISLTFMGLVSGSPLIGLLSHFFSLRIAFIPPFFIGIFIAIASFYFRKKDRKK